MHGTGNERRGKKNRDDCVAWNVGDHSRIWLRQISIKVTVARVSIGRRHLRRRGRRARAFPPLPRTVQSGTKVIASVRSRQVQHLRARQQRQTDTAIDPARTFMECLTKTIDEKQQFVKRRTWVSSVFESGRRRRRYPGRGP